jgi:NADH:ubiquinone reductase (H+-translocating)
VTSADSRPRVLVIGTGFAGSHCLRTLERRLPADAAELIAVNPTDYMLYMLLLPEVAGGTLDPRRVAVPLRSKLPRTQLVLGNATGVNLADRTCTVVDVEGRSRALDWDYVVLTVGGVTRLLSIPGVAEHAIGFKSVAERIFVRDHVLRQWCSSAWCPPHGVTLAETDGVAQPSTTRQGKE